MFSRETVTRCLEESRVQLDGRPTVGLNFLPVLIERFAYERLWAGSHDSGLRSDHRRRDEVG